MITPLVFPPLSSEEVYCLDDKGNLQKPIQTFEDIRKLMDVCSHMHVDHDSHFLLGWMWYMDFQNHFFLSSFNENEHKMFWHS